jgi:serine/threonine protein kinase
MRNQLHEGVVLNGRYKTISPLNHGSFGMVFQAKDMFTGQVVAVKVITKTPTANGLVSYDERSEELQIHHIIASHPNVVNLIESFETENHTYLVIEFCSNGDLYEAIRVGKGPLETEHVRDFMLQLVDAVEFIHSRGVYHRDIKPENIFLTQSGSMKLGDFGLATTDVWSYEIAVGSDRYMAPEQYDPSNAGYSTAKADIWAIGICLLNVLFSRNPFAVPNTSDPLYADFALDRQSLFDVFPNMSQDTFEVLIHCLAIDPEKRDLSLVRDALNRAVCFTTDDEILDDFCTADHEVVVASANREPLRTPSLSTPQENSGSFPWAKALAMSPQQPVRQLSAIPDTEIYEDDLFSGSMHSNHKWFDVKPEAPSAVSFADSGLGLSFQSTDSARPGAVNISRSKPMAIAGSLPVRAFNSMASVFGKKRDAISKSWSDLWDEEEEGHAVADIENNYLPENNAEVKEERTFGSGVTTPRNGLSEMKNPAIANNSRSRSPKRNRDANDHVSQQTGFIFEEHTPVAPKYSPPPKRMTKDKWAALGDKRRAQQQQQTPQKTAKTPMKTPKQTLATPNSARKRSRTGSWRRPSNAAVGPENHGLWRKLDWNASKDWRQHSPHEVFVDDIGDLEWVGGWNDLHL